MAATLPVHPTNTRLVPVDNELDESSQLPLGSGSIEGSVMKKKKKKKKT